MQKFKNYMTTFHPWTIIGCGILAAAGVAFVIYVLATRL